MKKINKRVIYTFIFTALLFMCSLGVKAVEPPEGVPKTISTVGHTVKWGEYEYPRYDICRPGSNNCGGNDLGTPGRTIAYEKDNNGNYLFCLDYTRQFQNNTTYTYYGTDESTDKNPGFACALIDIWNGYDKTEGKYIYKNYSISGREAKKYGNSIEINGLSNSLTQDQYVIIQMALWDRLKPNLNTIDLETDTTQCTPKEFKESLTKGALTVKLDNQVLSLTEDEKYYVSDKISVTTSNLVDIVTKESTNPRYSLTAVNAPEGYYFSTTPGGTALEKNNDAFITNSNVVYLNIPVAEESYNINEIKIVAKAKYNSEKVKKPTARVHRYHSNNANSQDVGYVDFKITTTTEQADLTGEVKVYLDAKKVYISKKDIANENELEGAHIVISNKEGEIIEEFDSTKESHEVYLPAGEYTLKETISPEGYQQVTTVFEFKVSSTGKVTLLSTESNFFKAKGSEITLYNKLYDVPDTRKTRSIIYLTIGGILIISGGILTYLIIRKRKLNNI